MKYISLFKKSLLLFMLISANGSVFSQFNIKVGYNLMFCPLKETNNLLDVYNQKIQPNTKKFKTTHLFHGLELGLRYKFSPAFSLEAGWVSGQSKDNEFTVKGASLEDLNYEWRLKNSEYKIGFENLFSGIGYGVAIGRRTMRYTGALPNEENKSEYVKESFNNLTFHLVFEAVSGNTAIAIKPYYSLPLGEINITGMNKMFNISSTNSVLEKPTAFGLSIVFYNGRQQE